MDVVGADVFYIPRPLLPSKSKEERAVLHCIDFAIRWPEAAALSSRTGRSAVETLEAILVRRWGAPNAYFFDLGGEFDSREMEAHCRNHGSEMLAAPRRAHYFHGVRFAS